MAGLKGITVNTAPEAEAHVYAEDDAAIFQSIFGRDGVSSVGQACKATVLSNNKIRVADGVIFVGGHFARIPYGEYEDCEIANGQSGKKRNDIIMAKFETTGTGGMDSYTCEVKQGTAGETAMDPELTQEDLYSGGKVREFPLYRVKIEGLSIVEVERLFEVVPTNEELIKKVAELNGKKTPQVATYSDTYTFGGSDRTVTIPKDKFPDIKSDNTIVFIGIYSNQSLRCKAIWNNGVQLTILGGSQTGNYPVSIAVFYI